MIFSHVLYQLSYLAGRVPAGAGGCPVAPAPSVGRSTGPGILRREGPAVNVQPQGSRDPQPSAQLTDQPNCRRLVAACRPKDPGLPSGEGLAGALHVPADLGH